MTTTHPIPATDLDDLLSPQWIHAPAPQARDIVHIRPSNGLFIGGRFVNPINEEGFTTCAPSTGEHLAEVAMAGPADVDLAVSAARKGYERWQAVSPGERGKYLYRIARIIQERSRELAVLETLDNGKPIKETRDVDLPLVAAWFFHHAG